MFAQLPRQQPPLYLCLAGLFLALVGAVLSPLQSLHLPRGVAGRHVRPGGQHGTDRMVGLADVVQALLACLGAIR